MRKILGLDLGTNSIGWSLISTDEAGNPNKIIGLGSRIIPMDASTLGSFDKGVTLSQAAQRTQYRSARRLRERNLLRRERLHRVLHILEFLPDHYDASIDYEHKLGKFKADQEPKLAWRPRCLDNEESSTFDFMFMNSFNEMLMDFQSKHPELLEGKNLKGKDIKIPYDWTIYYLRKKALTHKIESKELAWIILNFNQKRGYYQIRGEEDETQEKHEYVETHRIIKIDKGETDKKNKLRTWYNLTLSNGWVYSATFTSEPKWLDQEKEFLVTEELDDEGNIKITKDRRTDTIGKEKRKITPLPSFDEIESMSKAEQDKIFKKIKAKTELTISASNKTVGEYIYESLLKNPKQKIRGKLVRTIERKFYKDELIKILKKQIELQPELFSNEKYKLCIKELYRNNNAHYNSLLKRDFIFLFVDDILFYQRPLRSQKSSIGNCSLEYRIYNIKGPQNNKIEVKEHLKAIPKSNPYYQEFRLWQWLSNLKIYIKDDDREVTKDLITGTEAIEGLFDFLNNRKEIEQKHLIKYLLEKKYPGIKQKELNAKLEKYRWNFVEDKKYPCNETRTQILTRLKSANIGDSFLTRDLEQQLWHIIYSVTDKTDFEKALNTFALKNSINPLSFTENFKKFPSLQSDYGSYSEKAIKKLLPLMRIGRYWNLESFADDTIKRINSIINGEFDEKIKNRVREKTIQLTDIKHFQGLPEWLAKYVVYNRHSEVDGESSWTSVKDLDQFINSFKHHSLRNPIVEQVVTETLRVVRDIWTKYGQGKLNFFNEIHIELGREMKNTAEDRKRITNIVSENENTNYRIKLLLAELKNDLTVQNIRAYSPMQHEILKIYEEYAINSGETYIGKDKNGLDVFKKEEVPDEILKISKLAEPSQTQLSKYRLWLEQRYRSPYTGQLIPLSKLFTPDYEIEHIIPQSRYFDDSLSNKVICESAVNKLKDNQLGLEFIKNHHGEKIQIGATNQHVEIFSEAAYIEFVKEHYIKNRTKRNKLLLEEIPVDMIERQLNDTRYISKYITGLLSNLVREEKNDDGYNSKNIIPCNGKITDTLKQDWGLNEVWNELVLPRFERMNEISNSNDFTSLNKEGHKIPAIPLNLSKGFQKKRIDNRHHAMDALVIACATRNHINLLNNESAKSQNTRYDLQNKLRNKENWIDKNGKKRIKFNLFIKPWDNFTVDAKNELARVIVSYKQNMRIINKATNYYERFENGKKIEVKQEGINWAIRKPLHKATISGKVNLPSVQVPKGSYITATRKNLNTEFNFKKIEAITDTGIKKILKNYLLHKGNNFELAFSPEGLDELNRNIKQFNDGKPHQPIYKVRLYEIGSKFPLGQRGNKKSKYVEAEKGTNLFFAIYQDSSYTRYFETIPLNIVVERLKQGLTAVPELNELGHKLLFYLSPNDLVYMPSKDEQINNLPIDLSNLTLDQANNIYRMVSSTGKQCHFIRANIASLIKSYDSSSKLGELESLNKLEVTMDKYKLRIKEYCLKIKIDRLGKLTICH